MDDSEKKTENNEGDPSHPEPDASDVFQPAWIRRIIQTNTGLDRFLLDYGFNFLWRISVLFYIILFIKETL